jgi:hypothetical protein
MAIEVALFPVGAGQVLARVRVLRVDFKSFVGPFDRVVITTLVPIGATLIKRDAAVMRRIYSTNLVFQRDSFR